MKKLLYIIIYDKALCEKQAYLNAIFKIGESYLLTKLCTPHPATTANSPSVAKSFPVGRHTGLTL